MNTRLAATALIGAAALIAACTMKDQKTPALTGPSELGTSITINISPDTLTQDGASQSLVTITARDPSSQPVRNLSLRTEIRVGGSPADFGSLSARNVVTGSDGRATLVYTAPASPAGMVASTTTIVDIAVTPIGTNFDNSLTRTASLRLVPQGAIIPPDGLRPAFTMTPSSPTDNQVVLFDASTSGARSDNPISTYAWDFGDGGSGSGKTASHAYRTAGTYIVTLAITDQYGRSASLSQSLTVTPGALPTADFEFSPTAPRVGTSISFNASTSVPTAPGSRIVSYTWDFGDATPRVITGNVIVFHTYAAPNTYKVTLIVTDDAGRSSIGKAKDVAVGP